MAIQTTYDTGLSAPTPGSIGGSDFNSKTGICETVAGIGFGLAVGQGSADKGVVLGVGTGFLGISIRDVAVGAEVTKYPRYGNMGYISRGQIWVLAGAAVGAGDAVHYDAATGAISNSGGNTVPGARFVTSGANGARVLIELGANAGS
jgi:hypothetical protein